jgi:DNA primase
VSTPDMPKDKTLFNLDRKNHDDLVIVESPMTVMRHAHQASVAATFGAMVTDKQVDLMLRTGAKRIILWFDNDSAGWHAFEHVGEMLMERTVVYAVQSPFEGDPADLDDATFDWVLRTFVVPFPLWVRPTQLDKIGDGDGHAQVRDRSGDR